MLSDFIIVNKLKAKLVVFEDEVQSSIQASRLVGAPLTQIVKSLVFLSESQEPLMLVLRGSDRADMNKVKRISGATLLKLANPKQVLEITGYPIGGIPPISIFGIKTICDAKVMAETEVFCGGGDTRTLLRINPSEIQGMVDDFTVADITVN